MNTIFELDTTTWKPFKLGKLFKIRKGKLLTDYNKVEGNLPFISSIEDNNGVSDYVSEEPISDGNVLTVNCNGSVAEAFYQPVPFWATGDVNILASDGWNLTPEIGLFLCTVIRMEKYRFSYGRKWNLARMKESEISLPVTESGDPDWEFMKNYIMGFEISRWLDKF